MRSKQARCSRGITALAVTWVCSVSIASAGAGSDAPDSSDAAQRIDADAIDVGAAGVDSALQISGPPLFNRIAGRDGNVCTIIASVPGWSSGYYKMDGQVYCERPVPRLELVYSVQYWHPQFGTWVTAGFGQWFITNGTSTSLLRATAHCLNVSVWVRSYATANVYWSSAPNDMSTFAVASEPYSASADCF